VEITASSMEQNNGADQINNALMQLNNVTQQNAAASEELATSAEEMTSQAESLKNQVLYFNIGKEISEKRNKVITHKQPVATSVKPPKIKTRQAGSNTGVSIKLTDNKDDDYDSF
jgi:methyl-accepting chemotaxis protein